MVNKIEKSIVAEGGSNISNVTNSNNDKIEKSRENKIPLFLFLVLILGGVLIAFFGDTQNDFQRFCFTIITSLGAGLGATYLTGKITGGGKLGFINVKSATGGFFVWLFTFSSFFYFFPKSDLKKYPIIEGNWVYICSGHDNKYQHGGRFTAIQNGAKWSLNGERMWRDTLNSKLNKWDCTIYNPTKSWHSINGNIDDDVISFEYLIENVHGEDIHGYAKGKITLNEKNQILKVKGIFNQLFPSKQISGDIELLRVTQETFEIPFWEKNHKCN